MAGESSSFIRCQSTECPACTIRTCAELNDQSGLLIATSLCIYCAPETNLPFLCTRKNPCPTWPKQEQERFLQQRSVLPVGTSAATTPSQEARLEERSHLRRSPRLLALQARTLEEDEDDAGEDESSFSNLQTLVHSTGAGGRAEEKGEKEKGGETAVPDGSPPNSQDTPAVQPLGASSPLLEDKADFQSHQGHPTCHPLAHQIRSLASQVAGLPTSQHLKDGILEKLGEMENLMGLNDDDKEPGVSYLAAPATIDQPVGETGKANRKQSKGVTFKQVPTETLNSRDETRCRGAGLQDSPRTSLIQKEIQSPSLANLLRKSDKWREEKKMQERGELGAGSTSHQPG